MTIEGVNATETAGLSSADVSSTTSSVIPGDDYASGGPEPPENQPGGAVDLGVFDFDKVETPVGEDTTEEPDAATDEPPETPEAPEVPEPVKREQSPEANAAFAEMRRKTEQAERALRERDAWVEKNFGQSHGLKTWEQYQAAIEQTHRQQQTARQQELQQRPQQVFQETYKQLVDQGYDDGFAREVAGTKAATVAQNLQLQTLQEELASIKRQEQERKAAMEQEQQKQQQEAQVQQKTREILADHGKLRQEYGDLVPEDINQMDKATIEKVYRGYSLYDAWFLANRAKVMERTQKAASQKTLNNLNSKSHLKTEGDGAGDSSASTTPLSADTLQMYLDSGMTEKQARAFHKKLYG